MVDDVVDRLRSALQRCVEAHRSGRFEPNQIAYEAAANLLEDLDREVALADQDTALPQPEPGGVVPPNHIGLNRLVRALYGRDACDDDDLDWRRSMLLRNAAETIEVLRDDCDRLRREDRATAAPAPPAELEELKSEIERLRGEADGDFVQAAIRIMQKNPGFEWRDYHWEGISADEFEEFFTEDMNEAWRNVENLRERLRKAESALSASIALVRGDDDAVSADLVALSDAATPGEWRVEEDTTLIWGDCRVDDDGFVERMGVPVVEAQQARGWSRNGEPSAERARCNAALTAVAVNIFRARIASDRAGAESEAG